jgi:uncharacterized membrane protein
MIDVLMFIGQLLLTLGVLSLEQVLGVPVVTFALTLFFSTSYPEPTRIAFLLVIGVCLSVLFQLPFVVGMGLVFSLSAALVLLKSSIPGIETRLLSVSVMGGIVTLLISLMPLTVGLWSSLFVSVVVTWILSRVLYQPKVSHSVAPRKVRV